MKRKILSICIPVYNRKEIFKHCLIEACESSLEYADDVEVIISDNNSEDDIYAIVEEIKLEFKSISIKYHKNNINIGLCRNFLKVVEIAKGEFCWIIGSDDFIKKGAIKILLDIIKMNRDISFINCNYDYLYLNKLKFENDQYVDIHDQLKNETMIIQHIAPTWIGKVNELGDLIDPLFNNVFLGAVMTGVFKRSLWDQVDKQEVQWDGFNSLESIYPHCYIYAKAFVDKKAFYYGNPLITVGEGAREWSTDTGKTIWESSLPLIYFNILAEMINTYRNGGLNKTQYKKCKKDTAKIAGNYFFPILVRKYILRKEIKDGKSIEILKVLKLYVFTFSFYKGILLSILKGIYKKIKP